MTYERPGSRLDSLGLRLGQFRKRRHQQDQAILGTDGGSGSTASLAMQVGAELLAAMVVGAGIGWLLDWWLATLPLFFLVFFFLGAGSGMFNVFWRATEMNRGNSRSQAGSIRLAADRAFDGNANLALQM